MADMTIEQAQERILELEGRITELTNERDSLSQNNENLNRDLEAARTLNQRLFERVTTQESSPEEEEETVLTCEEFAKTLHL